MRFAHMVLLFVCISFPMYMLGYTSPLGSILSMQNNAPVDLDFIKSNIAPKLFDPFFIGSVIGLAVVSTVLGGFSAVYMIPLVIFWVIFNFVVVPSSYLYNSTCSPQIVSAAALCIPHEWQMVFTLFLNLIVLLTFAEYVRGGG